MGSPSSNPRGNIQLLQAPLVDAFEDRKSLIVCQTGTGGSATSGALVTDVHLMTRAQVRAAFGEDEAYHRINNWFLGVNKDNSVVIPKLDVISLDPNGSGVAATAEIAFSGTATSDGTLRITAVDQTQFQVDVSVTTGDTATEIAAAVDAAFDALDYVPFTASNATGTLTLTADDVGSLGNTYGLKYENVDNSVAGVTATLTGWAGGSTDPSFTGVFDVIEGIRYTSVSWPEGWTSDLDTATDYFSARFNASNQIMDGVVFHGFSATVANAKSKVASLNDQSLVVGGNNKLDTATHKGPAILQPADWILTYFMSVDDKRLSTGSQIADRITASNAPNDATGGPALASLPYFNTPLANAPVTSPTNLYTATEQVELENAGFTTFGVNRALNTMIMGPVVTTRTTDAAGNANDSFLYLNYVRTGSVCREIFFNVLKSNYSQSRLTQGDLVPGRSIENENSIRADLLDIYQVLAANVLVQAGQAAVKYFSDNTTIDVTLATGSVAINGPLPIVTQIRDVNYNLALDFDIRSSSTTITL
ncbi:MAG: tail sheath protein [Prokaryotic dsDNA virus sp.]|nr:MAG: tail sheath protein [Prokaryotic dsDNA virus sp.]|tara:strand:- start:50299 stop:51903 length:1605 start_codon:yes stop_codon:yes gene_type:complete